MSSEKPIQSDCDQLSVAELRLTPIDNDQSSLNTKLSDRFRVTITLPSCIKKVTNRGKFSDSDKLIFSAITITTPKITIPSIPITYLGKTVKLSSKEREPYDDISVTFKIDSEFKSYAILYSWLNFLSNENTGVYAGESGSPAEYTANIEIDILDEYRNDVTIATWKYRWSVITGLNPLELSYLTNTELQGTFTFAFTDFEFSLAEYQK